MLLLGKNISLSAWLDVTLQVWQRNGAARSVSCTNILWLRSKPYLCYNLPGHCSVGITSISIPPTTNNNIPGTWPPQTDLDPPIWGKINYFWQGGACLFPCCTKAIKSAMTCSCCWKMILDAKICKSVLRMYSSIHMIVVQSASRGQIMSSQVLTRHSL